MSDRLKVAFHTLGCKLNFSETSTLARQFGEHGFERVSSATGRADIHVVNTCSVTDHADKKCRNIIRRLAKSDPEAIIAVTGCYAQLKAEEIAAIEGVDLVVGNQDKGNLYELVCAAAARGKGAAHVCQSERITSFFNAFSSGDRNRAFLKVQDGCSYNCSYCTIPLARGGSRNSSVETLVREAETIAARGIREIVLTGVNIGDFGRTTGERFFDLIRALEGVEGIERYRISSIEPNLLTDEILEFTHASAKFQPHFHIPLQSGSDKILRLMRRRYNTEMFRQKIEAIRRLRPDTFIGIDVIVGFPGETEEDFMDCYRFLESLGPAYLHIFPYSERANTDAISYEGKVSPQEKADRAHRLDGLCRRLHRDFCRQFTGQRAKVLVEGRQKGGMMYGYTGHYVQAALPYRKELIGTVADVRIESVNDEGIASGTLL